MAENKIETIFGNATLNRDGYYKINTGSYRGKLLHRVIFEDFYQCNLNEEFPNGIHIHHIDGNRSNNNVWNLEPIIPSEHQKLHQNGENNNMYGICSNERKMNISKSKTTTGIFRVYKQKAKSCKQGFTWKYQYYDENRNKRKCESVDLLKLKQKVISKELEWIIIDKEIAQSVCNEYGYDLMEVC